jgi:hypothetical protein
LAEWFAAIDPLQDDSDVRPLAQLLRSGRQAPVEFLEMLAELIDPKKIPVDVQLVPKRTNALKKMMVRGRRGIQIACEMRKELDSEPRVTHAALNVAERLGVTDRYVQERWAPYRDAWPNIFGVPNKSEV